MERRHAGTFESLLDPRRRLVRAAAESLSSADGRWAIVSTSITALIAGSIAWLAAGTAIPTGQQGYEQPRSRILMPYELFQRLVAQTRGTDYAIVAPLGSITSAPAKQILPPATPLDESLAAENDQDNSASGEQPGIDTRDVTLERGDTLPVALVSAGATPQDAEAAVIALAKVFSPRQIKAGQVLQLTFAPTPPPKTVARIIYTPATQSAAQRDAAAQAADTQGPGRLLSVSFSPTIEHDVTITRGADDRFSGQDAYKKLEAHYHRVSAKIDSSLYLAAMQAGIPARVVVQLIHMFSYEVDFQRDIKPGDSFDLYYNYYYTPDGKPAKEGEIAYAAMHLLGRTVALYRYQPKDEDTPDYFDAHGQSAKSMLMKTPVDGARISSGFGMRFHPILGYSRMHKGVDFAVPTGTPVMAAGAGVIQTAHWENGYGNFVLLNHGSGYATAYAHLSRFGPGIHPGSHVRQGQVIAYSGETGMATGPHLHYEIRIDGQQVNPTTVKVARGRILFGNAMRDFEINRIHVDSQIAALPLEGKLADTATDLRAGN
ncbi:MAG TPA: M23 family metallopeptidase [Rhizomicrobium sp.]|nr:M23 family metallopeptidase [Rhizomicrobium sp.]